MKFISNKKIGHCVVCREEGKEALALAVISKKKLCPKHLVKLALCFYGDSILGLKQSNEEFVSRVLNGFMEQSIEDKQTEVKDEIGLL